MASLFRWFGDGLARVVRSWSPRERRHAVAILLAVLVYGGHYLVWCWPQPWYIEDAAISFSYARNLVEGEGLVPYPGGERVEGYSNPLWTFLLAAFHLVGIDPWVSSKLMGFAFGALTLPVAWAIARRARPDADDDVAVLPPFLLAASTQFVLWNDSGLENSLFGLLLATGIWRTTAEIQDGRRVPWSALAWFGLAITRPDGMMYAAAGAVARVLGTLRNRQWAALGWWIVGFAVPFGLYQAWRIDYFAWEFPNTYYAKERDFRPFNWTSGGWKQVKEWMTRYWIAYVAPLPLVIAVLGWTRWRRWLGLGLLAVLAVVLLWDGSSGVPGPLIPTWAAVSKNWTKVIVWYLLGGSVLLGLFTLPGRGWEARALLWASFCGGCFFWVWSGSDWMKGFRWGSLVSVPLFTLVGLGLGELALRLPFAGRRLGPVPVAGLFAVGLGGVVVAPNVMGSIDVGQSPETSPNSVHRRVNYMKSVQKKLGLEDVTLLDVDMGAHMWWASDWWIADMAGLIDVPMAHHRSYPKAFVDEYVYEERRPDFAHVHGSWARTTKIPQNPKWKERYLEIPGYPTGGRSLHVGNHVRKDHLVGAAWAGPEGRAADFEGGVRLAGWDVPSPEIAQGGKLYVDTGWSQAGRKEGFRVLVFLADEAGGVHAAEVMPGYDWYRPEKWKADEVVWGRWSIPIPEDLPRGRYELGFVLLDQATGGVLAALPAPAVPPAVPAAAPAPAEAPVYLRGEHRTGQVVVVGTPEEAITYANADYAEALRLAGATDCAGARATFRNARRHVPRNEAWYQKRLAEWEDALVRCYVAEAAAIDDPVAKGPVLEAARRVDHHHPALLAVTGPLGEALEAQGDRARAEADWEGAYRAYAAALQADPTRSHARRKAEEARNHRLGLDEEGKELPKKPAVKTPVGPRPAPAVTPPAP